jgi:hypothetical protein
MVVPVKASAQPGHPVALLAHPLARDCSQLHVRRSGPYELLMRALGSGGESGHEHPESRAAVPG